MDDQLLRKITTSNLQSPVLNTSDNLNISRVQMPYTYDIRNKLSPSPSEKVDKRENPPNRFINDANSRLLNSRHLGADPSKSFGGIAVTTSQNQLKAVLTSSPSNSINKQDDGVKVPSSYSA